MVRIRRRRKRAAYIAMYLRAFRARKATEAIRKDKPRWADADVKN